MTKDQKALEVFMSRIEVRMRRLIADGHPVSQETMDVAVAEERASILKMREQIVSNSDRGNGIVRHVTRRIWEECQD